MKINATKIRIELAKINKSHAWIARKLGMTRQNVHYFIKANSTKHLKDVASLLNVDPEDLLE